MSIKIVTDSTCDLPRELIHAHHISVIPLHINKGEDSFLDGLEITPEDIFSYVEKGGDICTTQQLRQILWSCQSISRNSACNMKRLS